MSLVNAFLSGAIAMGYVAASLFFLKFYFRTADRLFAIFCAALWLLGLTRILLVASHDPSENHWIFILRLVAYLLILGAILDKNFFAQRGRIFTPQPENEVLP
jgi:hypothetical protein